MDPNAAMADLEGTLADWRKASRDGDRREAADCKSAAQDIRRDIREWLARGGFEPTWERFPHASTYVNL